MIIMEEMIGYPIQRIFLFRVRRNNNSQKKKDSKLDYRHIRRRRLQGQLQQQPQEPILYAVDATHIAAAKASYIDTYLISYTPMVLHLHEGRNQTGAPFNTTVTNSTSPTYYYHIQKHSNITTLLQQMMLLSVGDVYEGTEEELAWLPTGESCSNEILQACYDNAKKKLLDSSNQNRFYKCLVQTWVRRHHAVLQKFPSVTITSFSAVPPPYKYYPQKIDMQREYWIIEINRSFEVRKRRIPFDLFQSEASKMLVKNLLFENQIISSQLQFTKPHLIPILETWMHSSREVFLHSLNLTSEQLMDLIPEISPYQILQLIPDGKDLPNLYQREETIVRVGSDYFALLNGTRNRIKSAIVFFHHGWEFSKAIGLASTNEIEFIPEGPMLVD
jgi:hypothetical protein